jgi:folate-binding protein YgfZ
MLERSILAISGTDRRKFLQGLITNDIARLDAGLMYAALLSPQGKFICDFFLFEQEATIYVDVAADKAEALVKRLSMYKLRADVGIKVSDFGVALDEAGFPDPRHPELAHRLYAKGLGKSVDDQAAIRIAHVIPESGPDIDDETYILEAGFERLNGVDFKKGCYVGQEVTARMKHKTELRKGFCQVDLNQAVATGTAIVASGKEIGKILTVADNKAIAYLRFDRAGPDMMAGPAHVTLND